MIDKKSFTKEYISNLRIEKSVDPQLLERTIYAFGLLEALANVKLPFVFKGGTSLMLLLESPKRLSTDIDIIVEPGIDVEDFIKKASEIFPFKSYEKQIRKGKNNIDKVHYKFIYDSPLNKKEFYILLDIVFEHNTYEKIISKEIKNEVLFTIPPYTRVLTPSADCLLGDKLTAFAPHTTGIRFEDGKGLEVIKQMFDIACLYDVHSNFTDIYKTFNKKVQSEINYRGLSITNEDVLKDTIDAAACIIGRGKVGTEYSLYAGVMRNLSNHIYSGRFSGETAAILACKVLYMAVCVLKNKAPKKNIEYNSEYYKTIDIGNTIFGKLSYLKKVNLEGFAFVVESAALFVD